MIRGKIKEILESMGFNIIENGKFCRAKFIDDASGDIIKILGKMDSDANGVPQIKFFPLDKDNNVVDHAHTLDQIIMDYETHLLPLPKPSNNNYECVYTLRVQVPVQMCSVMPETYQMYIDEGCKTEAEIAERVATYDLKEFLHLDSSPFNLLEIEPEYTNKIE